MELMMNKYTKMGCAVHKETSANHDFNADYHLNNTQGGMNLNLKIERIGREIDKIKAKISEQQTKLRELEKQRAELENLEIVDIVRGKNISFSELAQMLETMRNQKSQEDISQ
jgi:predicted RNase H-like nuclease (RuvC/YqgF family)